jgi:uncharacterized caspase-like protein
MSIESVYRGSYAIVVGIDKYKKAPPLGYAVNDAKAFAELLIEKFGFPKKNINLLVDKAATKANILESFLSFASGGTDINDRVIFFFAGHGYTVRGNRGEVGFLVPQEADTKSLASLIRWDELTRDADLIDAKHILFLMDACYGGLAITRSLQPGSMRFLKDMLLRPARQVLTAGKANEVVADLGGPLPDHSVFTGHILDGLQGKAVDSEGILTANGLMAYAYQTVGQDPDSHQTPHYGYLNGDGDLIFAAPQLGGLTNDEERDADVLVSVPAIAASSGDERMNLIERTKEYLSEDKHRINLHDLVANQIRHVLSSTGDDNFPIQGTWSKEAFLDRIAKYEGATKDICSMESLLGYWGTSSHLDILTLPPTRMAARLRAESGLVAWNQLRWYPILLLLYAGGIAAIAAGKYQNLRALFQSPISDPERSGKEVTLMTVTFSNISDLHDQFKLLPGHEKNYTPRSEYLLKVLQPTLDDLLFLGPDYERHFDRFEVLVALEFADQYLAEPSGRAWGPVGRFGWKYRRGYGGNPFLNVLQEAEKDGSEWPPVRAGLFGGSIERFKKTVAEYSENVVTKLNWF